MKVLVTGAAGFIGYHLCRRLTGRGDSVVGIDNLNDYYDVGLKYDRLCLLGINRGDVERDGCGQSLTAGFRFEKIDIADKSAMSRLFEKEGFDIVVNLAAQAGVRYSIENPSAYIESNLVGFANVLECCRHYGPKRLVYASSSSVYGGNTKVPFSEADSVDNPVSLYAATKKSNELMAAAYSNLYGIDSVGLRFFTVYGPWGRPDMAPMLFASAISEGRPIKVFNYGEMSRDFTYIDDIIDGTVIAIDNLSSGHEVFNIGRGEPVNLMEFINCLERVFGSTAEKQMMPMQPGDVPATFADTSRLRQMGYSPRFSLSEGIAEFAEWYEEWKRPN